MFVGAEVFCFKMKELNQKYTEDTDINGLNTTFGRNWTKCYQKAARKVVPKN